MTVSTTNVKDSYTGNGSNVTFAITFQYQSASQVYVKVDGVLKSSPTDYSIVGANVVFVAAPASSKPVVIYRQTVLTQTADYLDNAAFPAETHEKVLDKLVMIVQEQAQKITDLEARVTALE